MARTLVTGNILRSGSIPTTALGGGVVTSSLQIVASLPTGSLSSSAQVNYPDISNIPGGIASSSAQVIAYLPTDTVSSSVQVTAFLPTGTVSSSGQVTAFLPTGTVSSSGQIDITGTTNYSTFSSSLATVDTAQSNRLTTLESVTGSYATTGSNTFVAPQTISDTTNSTSYLDGALHVAGGMSVRQDVRISGSMTINGLLTAVSMSTQYVTSSQYNVGTSRITLNDDDNVRFAGLSIIDSGSSSPTSASILWDSLQHRFIYENLSGSSYNSSIIIAGPKHTGSLGDEPTLTSGYIPVATGTDHIDNSVMFQSSSNIGIGTTTPGAKLDVVTGTARFRISNDGSGNIFEEILDSTGVSYRNFSSFVSNYIINTSGTERMRLDSSGNVGIGTTSPVVKLQVDKSSQVITSTTPSSAVFISNLAAGNAGLELGIDSNAVGYIQNRNITNATYYNLALQPVTGNVGIGTTSPLAKLSVGTGSLIDTNVPVQISTPTATGQIYFGANKNGGYGALFGYDNNAFAGAVVRNVNNEGISFVTNNTAERVRILSDGNVGIGTTNPGYKLEVRNSGNIAQFYSSDGTYNPRLIISGSSEGIHLYQTYSTGADSLIFGIANVEQMRIKGSNVGIGTTSPEARLDIIGATQGTVTTLGSEVPGLIVQQRLTSDSNGNAGPMIDFRTSNGADVWTQGAIATIAAGTYAGQMAFYTQPGGTTDTTGRRTKGASLVERMRINESGNIGIGTTNPSGTGTTLEIKGVTDDATVKVTGNTAGNAYLQLNAGSSANAYINSVGSGYLAIGANGAASNAMTILSSGNVGIGTTNPANLLHVKASGNYGTIISDNSTNQGGGAFGVRKNGSAIGYLLNKGSWYGDTTNDLCVAAESGFNFRIYTDGSATEKFIFTTSGNLGIGTTDPSSFKLQVAGNVGPNANGTYDLGSTSLRWSTVYTSDLSLSNGIGDWTIVEGEDDLFIYNNKNNKVYKFTLQEVDPSTATPKKS